MPRFTILVFPFLLLLTFFTFQTLAQIPPNGINYQAVVRDVSGSELTNTAVVFRFTIRTGSTSGTLIYQETQNTVTNSYGLVFLVIGQGTQTIASPGNSLSQLNWLSNSTFVNVEIAIGASPFTSMGSSQYLTTPYSFVSGTAISVSGGNVNAANLDIVNGIRFESMNKNGAVLTVDGTGKVGAGYITGTTYTAGSGISITGSNQIINTGGNINLSGLGTTILGSGTSNPTVVGQKLVAGSNITITGSTISAAAPSTSPLTSIIGLNGITVSGSNNSFTLTSGIVAASSNPWTTSGSNVYLQPTFSNVGIGINNPLNDLQFKNSFGIWNLSISGQDYGMMTKNVYYPGGANINYQTNGPAMVMFMNTSTAIGSSFEIIRYDSGAAGSIISSGTNLLSLDYLGNVSPGRGLILYNDLTVNGSTGNSGDILISQGPNSSPIWSQNPSWNLSGNSGTNASLNFIGTTDAQALYFKTNNIQRMGISSNGNIGIGTSSPLSFLDVAGGVSIGNYAGSNVAPSNGLIVSGLIGIGTPSPSYQLHILGSNPSIAIEESGSSNANLIFMRGGAPKWYLLENFGTPTDNIGFYDVSSSSKVFQINPGGNVGIGTSPVSKLDVNGGVGIGAYAGVNTAPTNGLIISGNVGIGTSSPVTKLDVRGSSGNTINSSCNDVSNGTSWGSSGMKAGIYGSAGSGSTQFQAGVYGYQIGSGINSGGVVGAYSSSTWGALGYVDGTSASYGGYFAGSVHITGTISKGGGTFKIDHPLDPENKYLYHSFVESPDMMNIYNDNVVTDNQGFATIKLPDYFSALNKDFRYQLTPIGQFAQAIVFTEIDETVNSFIIQTDKPNVKVSWQVTGIRKDAFANANRVVAEVNKHSSEKGKYLHPEVHGKSKTLGIHYTGEDSKEKE